jgi:hypothetical protein
MMHPCCYQEYQVFETMTNGSVLGKKNDPPGNLMSSCGHRMPQVKTRHGGLLNLPIKHTSFIWGVSEDVNMVIKEGILLYLVFKQTHLITTV